MRARDHVGDDLGSAGYGTDGSSTPITVALREPSRIVLPITDGSLLSELSRSDCVSTATPAALSPSSAARAAVRAPGEAHHVEVMSVDDAGLDDARIAEPDQREFDRGEFAERFDGGDARGSP